MMFLFLLTLLIPYLVVGAFVARNDYARRLAAAGGAETQDRLQELRRQLKDIKHTSSCWRGPVYRSTDYACDCNYGSLWKSLNKEISSLSSGRIDGPYKMMFAYPVLGFHRFMTTGTYQPKGYDPYLTARLEREVEMEPLEIKS